MFGRKYARAAQQYTDAVFLEIFGDETKDTRQMMIDMSIKVTPTFVLFRGCEKVHSHGGINETNLHRVSCEAREAGVRGAVGMAGWPAGAGLGAGPAAAVCWGHTRSLHGTSCPIHCCIPAAVHPPVLPLLYRLAPLQYVSKFLEPGEAGYGTFSEPTEGSA
jgi:hypothetical protein